MLASLLEIIVELIASIWITDAQMRDGGAFGESAMEKRSRTFVAWLCGGTIALLGLAAVAWWWFTKS